MYEFDHDYLKQIILQHTDTAIMEYVCVLFQNIFNFRSSISNSQSSILQKSFKDENLFIQNTFRSIALILKSKDQPPQIKEKSIKLIMYLLLINEPIIDQKFKKQLFPFIKMVCNYNKSVSYKQRGSQFFKNTIFYENSSYFQRQKLKQIGKKFVIFCLQTLHIMAFWVPQNYQNQNIRQISVYQSTYNSLTHQLYDYPSENQFIYYTDRNIREIQQNIQICEDQLSMTNSDKNSLMRKRRRSSRRKSQQQNSQQKNTSFDNIILNNQANKNQSNSKQNRISFNQIKNIDKDTKLLIMNQNQQIQKLKKQKKILFDELNRTKKSYELKLLKSQQNVNKLSFQIKYLMQKVKDMQNSTKGSKQINNNLKSNNNYQNLHLQQKSIVTKLDQQIQTYQVFNHHKNNKNNLYGDQIKQNSIYQAKQIFIQSKSKFKRSRFSFRNRQQQRNSFKNKQIQKKKNLMNQLLKIDCQQKKQYQQSSIYQNKPIKILNDSIRSKSKSRSKLKSSFLFKSIYLQKQQKKQTKINQNSQSFNHDTYVNKLLKSKSDSNFLNKLKLNKYTKYQLQTASQFYEPFYSTLSQLSQIRLKKCLLKNKQILYKNQDIQIITKTNLIGQNVIRMQIMLKNISKCNQSKSLLVESNLKSIQFQIMNRNKQNEIKMNLKNSSKYINLVNVNKNNNENNIDKNQLLSFSLQRLSRQDQIVLDLQFILQNFNFQKSLLFKLNYINNQLSANQSQSTAEQVNNLAMMLPLSKIKLINPLKLSNNSQKYLFSQRYSKNINVNTQILSNLQKLRKYYGQSIIMQQSNNHNQRYVNSNKQISIDKSMKMYFKYISRLFYIVISQISHKQNKQKSSSQNLSINKKYSVKQSSQTNLQSSKSQFNKLNKLLFLIKIQLFYQKSMDYFVAEGLINQFMFILSK